MSLSPLYLNGMLDANIPISLQASTGVHEVQIGCEFVCETIGCLSGGNREGNESCEKTWKVLKGSTRRRFDLGDLISQLPGYSPAIREIVRDFRGKVENPGHHENIFDET